MNIRDFALRWRSRWILIFVTMVVAAAVVVALTLRTTPVYQASTKLVVSTTSSASASENHPGDRSAQERVLLYTKLLVGESLAQRTIDKLHLNMSAKTLQGMVKASGPPEPVVIEVSVLDPSAIRARDIANALSDEFVSMVRELETTEKGDMFDVRVVVEQHASTPKYFVFPKMTQNVAFGLAFGLLLGVDLAIFRGRFESTIKDSSASV